MTIKEIDQLINEYQEATHTAVMQLDVAGTVMSWNRGVERVLGYRMTEIVGKNASRFYPEAEQLAGIPALHWETAIRTGRFEAKGWQVRRDGHSFWAHYVIIAISDEENKAGGFIIIINA